MLLYIDTHILSNLESRLNTTVSKNEAELASPIGLGFPTCLALDIRIRDYDN